MKLQESKKELAGILLSQHDGDQVDTTIGVLEVSSKSPRPSAALNTRLYSALPDTHKISPRICNGLSRSSTEKQRLRSLL